MKKIICYETEKIDQLIELVNGLKIPILENAEKILGIKEILLSGFGGEIKEEKDGVEQQEVRKG